MIRVVVAIDHQLLLRGIIDILESSHNIEIVGACSDGAQAVRAICELQPDVAILDHFIAAMTKHGSLTAANGERLTTAVVVLAAQTGPNERSAANAVGASGFLCKNSSPDELLHRVREAAVGTTGLTADRRRTARATSLRTDAIPVNDDSPINRMLTPREWKVMQYAAEGLSNKEIARRLNVTEGTAKCHLHNIYQKLGIKNRTALASLAFQQSSTRRRA